jgi:hypothetical protein
MATVKDNYVVQGTAGAVGELLVFRQRGGKTFISKFPRPSSVPPTDKLKSVRAGFASCIAYAKKVVKDPVKKALYQSKVVGGQTAFNKATSDALNPPKINNIRIDQNTLIIVEAVDDFMVAGVTISIHDLSGNLIEEGNAELIENGSDWHYTIQKIPLTTGSKVTAEAVDLPGNRVSYSIDAD